MFPGKDRLTRPENMADMAHRDPGRAPGPLHVLEASCWCEHDALIGKPDLCQPPGNRPHCRALCLQHQARGQTASGRRPGGRPSPHRELGLPRPSQDTPPQLSGVPEPLGGRPTLPAPWGPGHPLQIHAGLQLAGRSVDLCSSLWGPVTTQTRGCTPGPQRSMLAQRSAPGTLPRPWPRWAQAHRSKPVLLHRHSVFPCLSSISQEFTVLNSCVMGCYY